MGGVVRRVNGDVPFCVVKPENTDGPSRTLHRNLLLPFKVPRQPQDCRERDQGEDEDEEVMRRRKDSAPANRSLKRSRRLKQRKHSKVSRDNELRYMFNYVGDDEVMEDDDDDAEQYGLYFVDTMPEDSIEEVPQGSTFGPANNGTTAADDTSTDSHTAPPETSADESSMPMVPEHDTSPVHQSIQPGSVATPPDSNLDEIPPNAEQESTSASVPECDKQTRTNALREHEESNALPPPSDDSPPSQPPQSGRPVRDRRAPQRFGYFQPGQPMTYSLPTIIPNQLNVITKSDVLDLLKQQMAQQQQQQTLNAMMMSHLLQG